MLGSAVITLDPIFSELACAFIFGIFASTAFTLIVVPLITIWSIETGATPARALLAQVNNARCSDGRAA